MPDYFLRSGMEPSFRDDVALLIRDDIAWGDAGSVGLPKVHSFACEGETEVTNTALEQRLFTGAGTKLGHRRHAEPDWPMVHRKLKRNYWGRDGPAIWGISKKIFP